MTMNKITFRTIFVAVLMILVLPMALTAMGNSEKPYGDVLDETFSDLAAQVESGEIDVKDAVDALNELRVQNNRPESGDYQEMEMLLQRIRTKEMTLLQAQQQLRLMDECKVGMSEEALQAREQNKTAVKTMTGSENAAKTGSGSGTAGGAGQSSGGNSEKSKK